MDENVPADVSDFIAGLGYRVAHIGREAPYLLPGPPKGTADALLKRPVQTFILITQDQRLLKPGAFPSRNRGVFVLVTEGITALELIQQMFSNKGTWTEDYVWKDRRFLVGTQGLEEIGLDGATINRYPSKR